MIGEKRFFVSTLLAAAGCRSETFRSWRNRNGLFPETQGSGGWNKFSMMDILTAIIVTEMTDRGVAAQVAVDAATVASTGIASVLSIAAIPSGPDDVNLLIGDIYRKVEGRSKVLFLVVGHDPLKLSTRLVEGRKDLGAFLEEHATASIVVNVEALLLIILMRVHIFGAEFIDGAGAERVLAGYLAEKDGADTPQKAAQYLRKHVAGKTAPSAKAKVGRPR